MLSLKRTISLIVNDSVIKLYLERKVVSIESRSELRAVESEELVRELLAEGAVGSGEKSLFQGIRRAIIRRKRRIVPAK